jgi:hypothetical protein
LFEEASDSKEFIITYSNDEIILTESITVHDDAYPIDVTWQFSILRSMIENVSLYVSNSMDGALALEKAYVPGQLDWQNPWENPTYFSRTAGWALVEFTPKNMTEDYVGMYDETNQVLFAVKFTDLPEWGNIGAVDNREIDALRFRYQLGDVAANSTVTCSYQFLTFSKGSYPEMNLNNVKAMFGFKATSPFNLTTRSYLKYIRENNVEFLVYEKNELNAKYLHSTLLQQVYANDKYIICKLLGSKS